MENQRWSHIDLLKVIAVFFMLLYHGTIYSVDFLSEPSLVRYLLYYGRTIVSTCVPLFFFVNGYLLFGKEFSLRMHMQKLIKLTVQTMFWAVITLVLLQVIRHEHFSLIEFAKAIWHWKLDWINHLRYMGALICIYLFFPLLKNVFDTNFKLFCYFTVVCSVLTFGNTIINSAVTVFSGVFSKQPMVLEGVNFFNIFNPLRGIHSFTFVYFCLGGIAYHFRNKINGLISKRTNVVSVTGIFVACLGLFGVGLCYSHGAGTMWDVIWGGYDSVFTLFNVIFIYLLSLNWKKDLPVIRLISENTLGIYYIHWILLRCTRLYIAKYDIFMNFPCNLVYVVVILAGCLAICWLLQKSVILRNLIQYK